ncbi:MAG: hypothetical protein GXO66_01860 [Euryarchaeota archaeon]|nr:hypothetical protein [Euryarchaeota archaeon]
MSSEAENAEFWRIIKWSIVIAVLVGVAVEAYLIYVLKQESRFSALYLVPGSYSNYIEDGSLSFTYGVECYEGRPTSYHLEIYLGERKIGERDFTLCNPGKKREERIELTGLRGGMPFPVKLRLVLTSERGTNEVHFWVKGVKERNRSG